MISRGLASRAAAEFISTALLLVAVVGSGIAAQRLSPHDVGLELLENSSATGFALVAIILTLGPISGAHLNPAVSLAGRLLGSLSSREMLAYWIAQVAGGALGTVLANLMFALPAVEISTKSRSSPGLWLGEVIATFGLLLVIFGIVRFGQAGMVAFAVGAYIAGAYGSHHRPASPTPRSIWLGCLRPRLPVLHLDPWSHFSRPNSQEPFLRSGPSASFAGRFPKLGEIDGRSKPATRWFIEGWSSLDHDSTRRLS